MASLTRRGNSWVHMRDTAFRVGDCAFFFTPCGGRQKHVGIGSGVGLPKRVLYHQKRDILECLTNHIKIRHGLRGICAGNPERLDFSLARRFKHVDGS